VLSTKRQPAHTGGKTLRLGFVPLVDAAPLIVAVERGYFADEGVRVELERQLGWGNVRDKLTYGQLDASHALVGMPLFSHLARDWFAEPLTAVMNLGSGGNAITVSNRLAKAGVKSGTTLAAHIAQDPRREALAFAHVFSCSMHHYLLRDWLSGAGIDPDEDVRLRIFPPRQLAALIGRDQLDGFCSGEPWNTLAVQSSGARIVAVTSDLVPMHPEKNLTVSRRWVDRHGELLIPLIRALLRACTFCDDESNNAELAELLCRPHYLDTTEQVVRASLDLEKSFVNGASGTGRMVRPTDWRLRSFAPSTTFPSQTHAAWLLSQMRRWNHLSHPINVGGIIAKCTDTRWYRRAAESMGIACPPTDTPPMRLRSGLFEVTRGFAPTNRGNIDTLGVTL
jgi:ABC-type nitrate/sulfonate/bicarbonate transport system substrate-binding protein